MVDFKGSHFEREIVLWGVRWYVAYPISYRQVTTGRPPIV
jgi:putative transposase